MKEHDTIRRKEDPPRGILNVRPDAARDSVSRYWPSADLSPFVEHYWIVRWDLDSPRVAETVPHPSVHMVLGPSEAEIVGLMRTRFTRRLEGRGRVVGTKFRPGGFRPFLKGPASALTGRRLPVTEVLGPGAHGLADRVLAQGDDRAGLALIESFLRQLGPMADDGLRLVARLSARIEEDRSLTRVDQLAREHRMTVRQLQRLFADRVGASPKWVIQRYRLLEAAERVAAGDVADWPGLALDLGYADQAHFIRDFKRLVGRSPAEYARTL